MTKIIRQTFDGVQDFQAKCASAPPDGSYGASVDLGARVQKDDWAGTKTIEEAFQQIDGWEAGRAEVEKVRGALGDLVPSYSGALTFQTRLAVAGDEPDVGLFLAGEPECMLESYLERTPCGSISVKVVFDCSVSGGFDSQSMVRRGAAAVAIVDALESAGLRVELDLIASAYSSGHIMIQTVPLKQAQDVIDLDRLAFWLASPAVLRRLTFRAMDHMPDLERKPFNSGYGRPLNEKQIKAHVDADILLFGVCWSGSGDAVIEHAKKILEDFID